MRTHVAAVLAAVLLIPPSVGSAQTRGRRDPRERSADLLRADAAARAAAARAGAATSAASPLATTGDPDSFGRNVRYLGLAQTLVVEILPDCSQASPEFERCMTPWGPEYREFAFADLGRIDLPAKATNSLICFGLTPFMTFEFWNPDDTVQYGADFSARAEITIENAALADPSLIDPTTGAPFGGKLSFPAGTYNESRSLGPWEYALKRLTYTRECVGGAISKAALRDEYGLTDTQATEFFKQPMTFRFGISGYASFVDYLYYFYGIRLYGD